MSGVAKPRNRTILLSLLGFACASVLATAFLACDRTPLQSNSASSTGITDAEAVLSSADQSAESAPAESVQILLPKSDLLELNPNSADAFQISVELSQQLAAAEITLSDFQLAQLSRITATYEFLRYEHEVEIAVVQPTATSDKERKFVIPAYEEFGQALNDAFFLTLQKDAGMDVELLSQLRPILEKRFLGFGQTAQSVVLRQDNETDRPTYWLEIEVVGGRGSQTSRTLRETYLLADITGSDRYRAALLRAL